MKAFTSPLLEDEATCPMEVLISPDLELPAIALYPRIEQTGDGVFVAYENERQQREETPLMCVPSAW